MGKDKTRSCHPDSQPKETKENMKLGETKRNVLSPTRQSKLPITRKSKPTEERWCTKRKWSLVSEELHKRSSKWFFFHFLPFFFFFKSSALPWRLDCPRDYPVAKWSIKLCCWTLDRAILPSRSTSTQTISHMLIIWWIQTSKRAKNSCHHLAKNFSNEITKHNWKIKRGEHKENDVDMSKTLCPHTNSKNGWSTRQQQTTPLCHYSAKMRIFERIYL